MVLIEIFSDTVSQSYMTLVVETYAEKWRETLTLILPWRLRVKKKDRYYLDLKSKHSQYLPEKIAQKHQV